MNIEDARQSLQDSNLEVRIRQYHPKDIFGGSSIIYANDNPSYAKIMNPFWIFQEDNRWISKFDGPGQYVTISRVAEAIDEAVKSVTAVFLLDQSIGVENVKLLLLQLQSIGIVAEVRDHGVISLFFSEYNSVEDEYTFMITQNLSTNPMPAIVLYLRSKQWQLDVNGSAISSMPRKAKINDIVDWINNFRPSL